MDENEDGKFFYPNELIYGTLEWQNASHKPSQNELKSFIEGQANFNTTKKTVSDLEFLSAIASKSMKQGKLKIRLLKNLIQF